MTRATDRAVRWVYVFPWLVAHEDERWTRDAVDIGSANKVAAISSLAIEHHRTLPLYALMPLLDEHAQIHDMGLETRASNLLLREQVSTFGDISNLTVADLFSLRGAGATTVEGIIRTFVGFCVMQATRGAIGPVDEMPFNPLEIAESEPSQRPVLKEIGDVLDTLASWHRARNSLSSPMLDGDAFYEPLPEVVAQAIVRLKSMTTEEWLGASIPAPNPAALLDELVSALPERDKLILERRILPSRPDTLDGIGHDLGVTRERVRQLESSLRGRFELWLNPTTEIGMLAASIRQRLGGLSRLARLLEDMPALADRVATLNLPAWYVIDKLDDGFESDGMWIAQPSLEDARSQSTLRFQQAESSAGVSSIQSIRESTSDWHLLSEEDLREWFSRLGYRLMGEYLLSPALRSQTDLAAAYLAIEGIPAAAEEIHESVAPTASLRSFKNRLGDDARFVRVDRNKWALREWGHREYSGIRETIHAIVRERGPQRLDALIEDLTGDFDVSPKSIAAYASVWPLETVMGVVRIAKARKTPRRSLSQTRGIYRTARGIAMRLIVNTDHLRGSGFAVPTGLATAVGLEPGDTRDYQAESGAVSMGWGGVQPAFGSIRRELLRLDATVGEVVFVVIDNETVGVRRAGPEPRDPVAAVRYWIDSPRIDELSSSEVASAIGLSPSSQWPTVIHALRDRGETEIVARLLEVLPRDDAFEPIHATPIDSRFKIVAVEDASD